MPPPLTSVITAVHNGADLLDRAIQSVIAQTCTDWEMIIVDDHSTDETPTILQQWADRELRIRWTRNTENQGPSRSRNIALRAATGQLIAYLDHDDEYYPDFLDTVAKLRDKADVLLFAYDIVEPDEHGIPQVRTWIPATAAHKMFTVNLSTPIGLVHRRSLLDRVGYFNELIFLGEDSDMLRRFARSGAEFILPEVKSGRYYVRPDSLSRIPRLSNTQRTTIEANWQAGPVRNIVSASRDS